MWQEQKERFLGAINNLPLISHAREIESSYLIGLTSKILQAPDKGLTQEFRRLKRLEIIGLAEYGLAWAGVFGPTVIQAMESSNVLWQHAAYAEVLAINLGFYGIGKMIIRRKNVIVHEATNRAFRL